MKILMDFLNLFGINVNINENRGVLRPPKGWACSAGSAGSALHSLFKGLLIINFIRRAAAAFVRHGVGFVKRQTSALSPPLCLRPRSSAPKEPGSARLALYAKQQDKALY